MAQEADCCNYQTYLEDKIVCQQCRFNRDTFCAWLCRVCADDHDASSSYGEQVHVVVTKTRCMLRTWAIRSIGSSGSNGRGGLSLVSLPRSLLEEYSGGLRDKVHHIYVVRDIGVSVFLTVGADCISAPTLVTPLVRILHFLKNRLCPSYMSLWPSLSTTLCLYTSLSWPGKRWMQLLPSVLRYDRFPDSSYVRLESDHRLGYKYDDIAETVHAMFQYQEWMCPTP